MASTTPRGSFRAECYGNVAPQTSRLLKVLPNGLPLYAPDDLLGRQEAKTDQVASTEDGDKPWEDAIPTLSANEVEARMKSFVGSLDVLRNDVEKYFIIVDREIRDAQKDDDATFRNRDHWVDSETKKAESLRELMQLRDVFSLLKLDGPVSDPAAPQQLALLPSIQSVTATAERDLLSVAVAKRAQFTASLASLSQLSIDSIDRSVVNQKIFLQVVRDIRRYWRVQKIPYAAHVFEQGDTDYPYRAEVRIEVLSLPSDGWGLRPKKWFLPDHLGVVDTPVGEVPTPPYLSWPPLPPISPFSIVNAEVYFTERRKNITGVEGSVDDKRNGRQKDGTSFDVNIRWTGDAAFCVEAARRLHIKLVPISIRDLTIPEGAAKTTDISRCDRIDKGRDGLVPRENGGDGLKGGLEENSRFPATPPLVGTEDMTHDVSKDLHRRLQRAQWSLLDRAVHLILQSQAALLKKPLDVVAFGSYEGSQYATSILEVFERFRKVLALPIPKAAGDDGRGNSITGTLTAGANQEVKVDRNIVVDKWETYRTALLLQGVPIYKTETAVKPGDRNSPPPPAPTLVVDLEVWINYMPESEILEDNRRAYTGTQDEDSSSSNDDADDKHQFLRSLRKVEALATCFIRHRFLSAWKYIIRQMPLDLADFHKDSLPATRSDPGARLLVELLDWLYNFLCLKSIGVGATYGLRPTTADTVSFSSELQISSPMVQSPAASTSTPGAAFRKNVPQEVVPIDIEDEDDEGSSSPHTQPNKVNVETTLR